MWVVWFLEGGGQERSRVRASPASRGQLRLVSSPKGDRNLWILCTFIHGYVNLSVLHPLVKFSGLRRLAFPCTVLTETDYWSHQRQRQAPCARLELGSNFFHSCQMHWFLIEELDARRKIKFLLIMCWYNITFPSSYSGTSLGTMFYTRHNIFSQCSQVSSTRKWLLVHSVAHWLDKCSYRGQSLILFMPL